MSAFSPIPSRSSYREDSLKQDIITEFHGVLERKSVEIQSLKEKNKKQRKQIEGLEERITRLESIIKPAAARPDPEQLLQRRSFSSSLPSLPFLGLNVPKPSSRDLTHEWILNATRMDINDGINHLNSGKADDAIAFFHKALIFIQESPIPPALKKNDIYAIFYHLAKCYELKGNVPETIAQAKQAVDYASNQNNEARALLALTFARTGEISEARKILAEFSNTFKITRKKFPTFPEWHLAKACIYHDEMKFTACFEQLLIVLKENTFNSIAITFLELMIMNEINVINLNKMYASVKEVNKRNPNPKLDELVTNVSDKISLLDPRRLSIS